MKNRPTMLEKQERCDRCNQLIETIASCGHKFFSREGKVDRLELDSQGRVFFVDAYKRHKTYTHYGGEWRKFIHGGTLRSLVIAMRRYICGDSPDVGLQLRFTRIRDLWGYPEHDAGTVSKRAEDLGLLKGVEDLGLIRGVTSHEES